jgi:hypothetical protein
MTDTQSHIMRPITASQSKNNQNKELANLSCPRVLSLCRLPEQARISARNSMTQIRDDVLTANEIYVKGLR